MPGSIGRIWISLSDAGNQLVDLDILSDAGINWSDMDILSDAGINWSDSGPLDAGINWSDLDILSDAGIIGSESGYPLGCRDQLVDLDILSDAGIIGRIWISSRMPDQLVELEVMSVDCDWTSINDMSMPVLTGQSDIPLGCRDKWSDLDILHGIPGSIGRTWISSRMPDQLSDMEVMSNKGVNWTSINDMSDAGINWSESISSRMLGINWSESGYPLGCRDINWSDSGISLGMPGINWSEYRISSRCRDQLVGSGYPLG